VTSDEWVVAVIVTWNRRDLLAEALRATLAQTRPPDRILVVDNASTDGTDQLLSDEFAGVDVVRTAYNCGGAGGFALGIRDALESAPDALVWLMDDDTVPEPGALATLVDTRTAYAGAAPALVASRVLWTDGRDHPMNTPRRRPGAGRADRRRAAEIGCVPIRSASFVSVLVDGSVIRRRRRANADN
jgi:rhamnopyranosyl-N-acetylglucosaminyl-diphospho-decaprenol beta-1,3/1,4-galactofuranosyltransferase